MLNGFYFFSKNMKSKKILVLTDNLYLRNEFKKIIKSKNLGDAVFDYCYSYNNKLYSKKFKDDKQFTALNVNKEASQLIKKYDLIISLHCKQVFPKRLVEKVRCINIHPGFNPHNRGYFSQVFSIINGLPMGTTIHEMDHKIDHGSIIAQKRIKVSHYDTSLSAYEMILKTEVSLIRKHIVQIIKNQYKCKKPASEGNINFQKDFKKLCMIDLNETGTFRYFIDKMRALSHGEYKNAYFIDPETKKRIYLRLEFLNK